MTASTFTTPSTISAASQSDQETGTSTTTYVSPGRQQFHQSACKAWVVYTSITTTTNQASYNITSLTDNGTGDTTVTIATDFSSSSYCCSVSGNRDNTNNAVVLAGINTVNTNRLAGSVKIWTADSNFSTGTDYYTVNVTFFGDQ